MEKQRSRVSFLRNTTFATISQGVGVLAAMVVGIISARYLGPAGKGEVALAMGVGMFLAQIFSLGFDRAAQYYIASDKLAPEKVLGAWIITFFIGTLITFGIAYPLLLAFCLDNIFEGVSKHLLLLASLICPLYLLRLLVNSILRGYEEFSREAYHNISVCLASVGASVLALVVLGYGPLGYVSIIMILCFISLIVGFVILRKVMPLKPVFSLSNWLRVLHYGAKASLAHIFTLIDLRLDIYIVNFFMDTSVVGIYTIAGALASAFWLLTNSIAAVLFSRVASEEPEESKKLTSLLCRNVLWLTAILGGLFLLISKRLIVFVYTEHFADASLALALLMPGVVGQAVSRICFTDCSGRGYPGKATIAAAITATITITFDMLLIPKYSLFGAAVASSIAYCTSGVLGIYWHIKLSGNSLGRLVIPRASDLKHYRNVFEKIKAKLIR